MRTHGTLAKWSDDRGFGLITLTRDGSALFVHVSAFPPDAVRPRVGERVAFKNALDGKRRAIKISSAAAGAGHSNAHERVPGKGLRQLLGRQTPAVPAVVIACGLRAYAYCITASRFRAQAIPPTVDLARPLISTAPAFD